MMKNHKIIGLLALVFLLGVFIGCGGSNKGGTGADVDMSNYYTKAEVNNLLAALKVPLAYGTIFVGGTVQTGSGNFTSTYNATTHQYEITVDGLNISWDQVVVNVTPLTTTAFVYWGSYNNKLIVKFRDQAGADTTGNFSFVLYKP